MHLSQINHQNRTDFFNAQVAEIFKQAPTEYSPDDALKWAVRRAQTITEYMYGSLPSTEYTADLSEENLSLGSSVPTDNGSAVCPN